MIDKDNFQVCPQCGNVSRREYFNNDTDEHSSFCFLCGRKETFYVRRDEWNRVICDLTDYIPLKDVKMYVDLLYIRNEDKEVISSRLIYKSINDIDDDELQRIAFSDFPMHDFDTLDYFMEISCLSKQEKKVILRQYKEKRDSEFAATLAVGLIHTKPINGEYVLDYFRNWRLVERDGIKYIEHLYPEMNEEYFPGHGIVATKGVLIYELERVAEGGISDEMIESLLEKRDNLYFITKYDNHDCKLKIIYERDRFISDTLNYSNITY